jgi:predicted nucleic acid-binding Zn ribbon protein
VLSEILGELFTARGYSRLRAVSALEEVWNQAVGEPHCHQTRIGEVRRGVLSVTVATSALLEELSAFRKGELLAALRRGAPESTIHDLRFRVGPLDDPKSAGAGKSGAGTKRRTQTRNSPTRDDETVPAKTRAASPAPGRVGGRVVRPSSPRPTTDRKPRSGRGPDGDD